MADRLTRIFIGQPRFSSRGPRYDVRLPKVGDQVDIDHADIDHAGVGDQVDIDHADIDHAGDVLVTGSLTPLFDAARALLARGVTGRIELWDTERERPCPRMSGDIAELARLAIEENETTGPKVRRWRPFAAGGSDRKRPIWGFSDPRSPKTRSAAGEGRCAHDPRPPR